jgi:hypothetical protein
MFDPVIDLMMRIKAAEPSFPDWKLTYIEKQFRADWGGDRQWIFPQGKIDRAARDQRIVETYRAGNLTMAQISQKFGLKTARIGQIIQSSRLIQQNALNTRKLAGSIKP